MIVQKEKEMNTISVFCQALFAHLALFHHFRVQNKRWSVFFDEYRRSGPRRLWGGHLPGLASGSSTTRRAIAVGTHLGTSTSAAGCWKDG